MEYARLRLPLGRDQVRALTIGDFVVLDGDAVVTIGLPTHQRIVEHIDRGTPLPFDLGGGSFFHLSVCTREESGTVRPLYVNPTTSARFNAFLPKMIRHYGLSVVAGKGGLDSACVEAMKDVGCVYLSMMGGASPVLTSGVAAVLGVAWEDLVMRFRLTRVALSGFGPLVVAIDAHGNSLYDALTRSARARMPDILARLHERRVPA